MVTNELSRAYSPITRTMTDGEISYQFAVYPLGSLVKGTGAVYAFVSSSGPTPVKYIGKSDDLSARLTGHEKKTHASRLGADQLWIHTPNASSPVNYLEAEKRLIRAYRPPLNTHYTS